MSKTDNKAPSTSNSNENPKELSVKEFHFSDEDRNSLLRILGDDEKARSFIIHSENIVVGTRFQRLLQHPTFLTQSDKLHNISVGATSLIDLLSDLSISPEQKSPDSETDYDTLLKICQFSKHKTAGKLGPILHQLRKELTNLKASCDESKKLIKPNITSGKESDDFIKIYFLKSLVSSYCLTYGGFPRVSRGRELGKDSAFFRVIEICKKEVGGGFKFNAEALLSEEVKPNLRRNRRPEFRRSMARGFHPNK